MLPVPAPPVVTLQSVSLSVDRLWMLTSLPPELLTTTLSTSRSSGSAEPLPISPPAVIWMPLVVAPLSRATESRPRKLLASSTVPAVTRFTVLSVYSSTRSRPICAVLASPKVSTVLELISSISESAISKLKA